jgi:mRNA-degrading endonuclease RelE of RelBE toxin-antitoxin system
VASNWKVEFTATAQAGLDQLREDHGEQAYQEALQTLLDLEEDPTPPDAAPLRKTKADYRVYLFRARYRGIYRIALAQRRVIVLRVGPRGGGIYKGYVRW